MIDVHKLVETLGGRVTGNDSCDVPGPGHSKQDHSLSIKLDKDAPDGFKCFSHAGDDWRQCRDYIRAAVGIPPRQKPQKADGPGTGWRLLGEFIYRDENNAPYLCVRKYVDERDKKRYVQARWDGGRWVTGKPDGPKIPYRLPQLLSASPSAMVYITEGEKCADALTKLGFLSTTNSEGAAGGRDDTGKKWPAELNQYFCGRNVVLVADNDAPGHRHVNFVAKQLKGIAATVRVIDLAKHWPGDHMPEGHDVCEFIDEHDRAGARLAAIAKDTPEWEPTSSQHDDDEAAPEADREIARLTKLTPAQYERERKQASEKLGMRASVLDKLVKDERPAEEKEMQGRALDLAEPEPWPDAVDGAALLEAIAAAIASHVIMPAASADIVALWAVHTHALDSFTITPRLAIMSPEKQCGKTTLLDVVACLVWRPLPTANATIAATFRAVEMARPTLLLDEADRFVTNHHDELLGVLNSGHRAGGSVLRTVGEDNEPRMFSTFAPAAFALIGRLPETLDDRSVAVDLRRRTASETVEPFRLDRTGHLHTLARKAARWASDHVRALGAADPDVGALFNRVADNWRPLLAIADIAGGGWPGRARKAAAATSERASDESIGVELLDDIASVFRDKQTERISSADLAGALAQIEGHRWAEWGRSHDKPLSQNALARLLKKFKTTDGQPIAPINIRIGDHVPKGYLRDQFIDAFARYLPAPPNSEPLQRYTPRATGTSATNQTATAESGVAVGKSEKPAWNGACSDVAVGRRESDAAANDGDAPDVFPRVCEHCGASERLGDLCNEVAADGRTHLIHSGCIDEWIATTEHQESGMRPDCRRRVRF